VGNSLSTKLAEQKFVGTHLNTLASGFLIELVIIFKFQVYNATDIDHLLLAY
jgi:hypothetical protein